MKASDVALLMVVTTTETEEDALRIAGELVERKLAACVQVSGPLTSIYRWKGELQTGREWRCTMKTMAAHYDSLERAIRELHPYEVPQIVAIPICAASRDYTQWIVDQTGCTDTA